MEQPSLTQPWTLLPLLPLLWQGLLVTMQVTALAAVLAALLALAGAGLRQSPWAPLRALGAAYVTVFRGTSLLVQLFWLFFVLPLPPFGLSLQPLTVGVLGLGLNGGAYGAELLRGALAAVPRGQHEAALVLGFTPLQRWRRVVLPQALRHALPPATTLLIELLKGSALVSLIGLADLSMRGSQLAEATFATGPVYGLVLLAYFVLAQAIHLLMRLAERRLARGQA